MNNKRCSLFNKLSAHVWEDVTNQRSYGPEPREDMFTPKLINTIRKAYSKDNSIGVWANQSYKEKKHGNDMDIFVEIQPERFIWYPLQAKVLKIGGTYEAICHGGDYQWNKLYNLSKNGDCYPYFLLYNGGEEFGAEYEGIDQCLQKYPIEQLGCSIVSLNLVEDKCVNKNGNCIPPTFDDFHINNEAEPWRILVCCPPKAETRTFTMEQIQVYTEPYRLISEELPLGMEEEVFSYSDGRQNQIIDVARESDHEPQNILLFRTDFS